jgi:nuclear RNA export factor
MLRQSSGAPPRGPRSATSSVRGGGRGGIQKRRAGSAPVKVDKDGDLVMDPAAADNKRRSGKGNIERASPKPLDNRRPNGGSGRGGNLGMQRAQQAILRGIGAQQANVRDSHIATAGTTLKVDGLSMSKAAGNADGGLESLLGFLERKAKGHDPNSNRVIKIKKVCLPP